MRSQERQPCLEPVSTRDFCLWTKVFTHSGSERVRCPFEAKKTPSLCQFVFPKLLCILSSSAKLCWATELRFWNYKESSSRGGMRTNSTSSGPNPSQVLCACVHKEGAAVCRCRRISVTLGLRHRCASLLLSHSFGFILVEMRAGISSAAAQKPSLTLRGCFSLGSHNVVYKGAWHSGM